MQNQIKYPRRRLIRHSMRLLLHIFMPLLTKSQVTGKRNFPEKGPLIVVGNHTAAMEVVMMFYHAPWLIEFMGSVDIPHENFMGEIINIYGLIPVFRGNVTPSSMKAGLDVLEQDGILGIFPEGGIWEPSIRRAQSGVAWLSYHGQAPVLPIGFGSTQGAIKEIFQFKRPNLKMNVGQVIPPVQDPSDKSRKQHFQDEANRIMDAVWELIPEEDRMQEESIKNEQFELLVEVRTQDGSKVQIPPRMKIQHDTSLSKFTHRPTLIKNFILNMNMSEVSPLTRLVDQPDIDEIITATRSILDHLKKDNPYYFTYRYGQREGKAMEQGIFELHELACWIRENSLMLKVIPVRRYKDIKTGQEVVLDRPEEIAKW